jgi:hypothetical protein
VNDEQRRRYRDKYEERAVSASRDFDRMILALAGGALGVSLAFIRDIAPQPVATWMLAVAWIALVVSLLCSLGSVLASEYGHRELIGQIDGGADLDKLTLGRWGRATPVLNVLSTVGVVGGVAFLAAFALTNL